MGKAWRAQPGESRVVLALIVVAFGCSGCDGKADNAKAVERSATPVASAGAPAAPVDTGPIMVGDHTIIRPQAVGPLRVGEWRRPVMSLVYAITARAGRDSEDIIVVRGIGKDTVTLTFQNDTLRKVFVTRAGPRTVSGLQVGTPFDSVAGERGANVTSRGGAKVATLNWLCGVKFATDSVALAPDSIITRTRRDATVIRAISIGYCKQ